MSASSLKSNVNQKEVSALLIGDPHFKINNIPLVERFMNELKNHLDNNKYNFIVCMGDLLDTHERIHMQPFKYANDFLKLCSNYAPMFLIVGNHDRINNSDFMSNIHPWVSLCNTSQNNINIIYKTTVLRTPDLNFLFVPYVPVGRFDEAIIHTNGPQETNKESLRELADDFLQDHDIITVFAHQEIRGVKMGFITSSDGDIWPEERPFLVSGHIHDYQKLSDNILYIGSPWQQSFDEDEYKTLSKITWSTNKKTTNISHNRIKLNMPIKKTIYFKIKDLMGDSKIINDYIIDSPDIIYRIILQGNNTEYKCFLNGEVHVKLQKYKLKFEIETELNTDSTIILKHEKTMKELLLTKIGDKKDLLDIYNIIFT